MAMGTPRDGRNFVKRFFQDVFRKITPEERKFCEKFFKDMKKRMMRDIMKHKVTQELMNHTTPSKIIKTRGSLFGFLGLVEGFDPIDEIVNRIDEIMKFKISRRLIKGGVKLTVTFPSVKDFRDPTFQLPWEGGTGLVDGIENGVSGLNNYIKTNKNSLAYSRSEEGIQVKMKVRNAKFEGTPWLSDIFKKYRAKADSLR